jgi:hypothetical protein
VAGECACARWGFVRGVVVGRGFLLGFLGRRTEVVDGLSGVFHWPVPISDLGWTWAVGFLPRVQASFGGSPALERYIGSCFRGCFCKAAFFG